MSKKNGFLLWMFFWLSLFFIMPPAQAATDCVAQTQIPKIECEALLELYNSTSGADWIKKDGWNENNTPCSWYGVGCVEGRVEQINLVENKLFGTLPKQLSNLTNLKTLQLHNRGSRHSFRDKLRGGLPPEWGNLANLQVLSLSYNQLDGSLPAEWSNLANLQILHLDHNKLSGSLPPEWSNLTNLQSLDLSYNRRSRFIYDLPPLGLDGSLPAEWGNLANLQYLSLSYNRLDGSLPAEWGNLANLQSLNLTYNKLSGSLPPEWGNLANLQSLNLIYNELSGSLPPEWGNLANLQSLNLTYNELSGSLPPEWGNLTNLQFLSLRNNRLNGTLPPEWSNLTKLQELYLSENQLSGSLPPEWGNLSNLNSIGLGYNQLSGSLPPEWNNLANLQQLFLDDNQLNGTLPPEWSNLTNLRYLVLNDNQLNGTLPPEWSNLTNLRFLVLNDNQLNGTLPPEWNNLKNLYNLYLASNQLSGSLPVEWNNLPWPPDLNFNMLTAGPSITASWPATQTIPPTNISAITTNGNIQLSWTPILYQTNGGYYEVGYSTTVGGPYIVQQVNGDKTASMHTITGLLPETTYYFVVRTYTPHHAMNPGDLTSAWSEEIQAAICVVAYVVHDGGLNDSLLLSVSNLQFTPIGTVHQGYDLEALALDPQTGKLYASSGENSNKPGYLYQVQEENVVELGQPGAFAGGLEGLSFNPSTNILWGWAQGTGLVKFDHIGPNPSASVVLSYKGEIQDITWSPQGDVLYAVENIPQGDKNKVVLWAYHPVDGHVVAQCEKELEGWQEVEALQALSNGNLLFGLHNSKKLLTGTINPNQGCQLGEIKEIPVPYDDIEGIALTACPLTM